MKIIIVGCGKVGKTLATNLFSEGHDVTMVDQDSTRLKAFVAKHDIMGVVGNCATHTTLEEAGIKSCDLMIAVNRRYGRSDYLPCISWGARAREASTWPVGTGVMLTGRIQSRDYTKTIDGESVQKTAYEISVITIIEDED